jgi:recombinational DNA repair ATPase RecF
MIRMEQVRGEMLERFERVDRRFAQSEQRLGRMDQRLADVADQIEALRADLLAQLELLAWSSPGVTLPAEPATEYVADLATPDEDYN